LQVARAGGVSAPLVAALEQLYPEDSAPVYLALAASCTALLHQAGGHLVSDLALLAAEGGELSQPGGYTRALQHYCQVIVGVLDLHSFCCTCKVLPV
jgi:hypothetical protein